MPRVSFRIAGGILALVSMLGIWGVASIGTVVKPEPVYAVAEFVKQTIAEVSEDTMRNLMIEHLVRMHLMDDEMHWAAPEFEHISDILLPSVVTQEEVFTFIDEMAFFAGQNTYLERFLTTVQGEESLERLIEKAELHGSEEFPSVIAYGMVLDRLTKAMVDDYRVLEVGMQVFRQAADEANMLRYTHTSELEKLHLVEGFILGLVYAHKTGTILPDFGTGELPANIMWAVNIDRYLGNTANAETGEILSKYIPGYGGGWGARMSSDGKIILLNIPEPLHWMNLYSTWNMAYVSLYQDFPMMIIKLLIPTVSNYQAQPQGYLYVRLIALYMHIYHQLLVRADTLERNRWPIVETVWNDEEFTRLWGEVNRESADDFEQNILK